MGLANVLCEWDYPMYPGNGTIYPMSPGKEQPNVPWKGTSQCAPGMGLSNVPCEWD